MEGENGITPVFSPYNVSDCYVERIPIPPNRSIDYPHDRTYLPDAPKDVRKEVIEGARSMAGRW
jgi:hypothetical protein